MPIRRKATKKRAVRKVAKKRAVRKVAKRKATKKRAVRKVAGRRADAGNWKLRRHSLMAILNPSRRPAVIYITAPGGHQRAARSLVVRALREALGDYRKSPYDGVYTSKAQACHDAGSDECYGEGRYDLDMTDEEVAVFWAIAQRLAEEGGWNHAPCDIYHD